MKPFSAQTTELGRLVLLGFCKNSFSLSHLAILLPHPVRRTLNTRSFVQNLVLSPVSDGAMSVLPTPMSAFET